MTTLRLTYEELGERIGCSAEGARMLARRRRWRVEKGNDGKARVLVDEADLVVRPTGRPPGPDLAEIVQLSGLQATVLALTERAAKAEGENAALHQLIDEFRAALEREQARGDRLEEALRRPWWWRWLER
jgi:hypothetical protein